MKNGEVVRDESAAETCGRIMENISRVVVGKGSAVELLLVALMAEGHLLVEDVPGLGKTLIAKSLAGSINARFKRVQCTPDLLPADITGFSVYNQRTGGFELRHGPVMTNVLLVDEINRAIPRTQSSLLESMAERQVTIDGRTLHLEKPFFVIATQNPIELEGTFPLPEAQLDRFLLKIRLGYPGRAEEMEILRRFQTRDPLEDLEPVVTVEQVVSLQRTVRGIFTADAVLEYIGEIGAATRAGGAFRYGASPRGTLGLMRAAQALAMIRGRSYVLPDDVKQLAPFVLAHRLIPTEEERLRGGEPGRLFEELLERVPVPSARERGGGDP
jgi:MoxR-like ATPase